MKKRPFRIHATLPLLIALLACPLGCAADADPSSDSADPVSRPELPAPPEDMPEDFKQMIPRGGIASIDDPVFVTADEARVPDDAWMLGVVVDGQAKAYSLNILNRHEIVNDHSGESAYAAVW